MSERTLATIESLRCKASNGKRQCTYNAEPGFDYCSYHSSGQKLKLKKENERNYLLSQWKEEVDYFANNSQVKNLREEIGILRLLMQTTLNRCKDAEDLMIYTPRIMELTQRIERVIATCHTMEEKTQFLVDKNQIIHLAEQILMIISEFIEDTAILSAIANKIQTAIQARATVTVVDGEVKDA